MGISVSPGSGAKELQKVPYFKYYNAFEWESRFTLGLNIAKNLIDYTHQNNCLINYFYFTN